MMHVRANCVTFSAQHAVQHVGGRQLPLFAFMRLYVRANCQSVPLHVRVCMIETASATIPAPLWKPTAVSTRPACRVCASLERRAMR
jgi:hypothetical protein